MITYLLKPASPRRSDAIFGKVNTLVKDGSHMKKLNVMGRKKGAKEKTDGKRQSNYSTDVLRPSHRVPLKPLIPMKMAAWLSRLYRFGEWSRTKGQVLPSGPQLDLESFFIFK